MPDPKPLDAVAARISDRAARLTRAADPAPSSLERGAIARMHWRAGLSADPSLADVVDAPEMSAEWPALLAETHARLLDPAGVRPLARPSPVGAAVGAALEASPEWQALLDASALHPGIARDAVVGLADVVKNALTAAGAAKNDTRRALSDLDAARKRLADARTPRERVEAGIAAEKAAAAAQAADAAAGRVGPALSGAGEAIAAVVAAATAKADGVRALAASGMGSALGCTVPDTVPDDVVELLTPEVAAMLRAVGALRLALREGRASRHLPGREGVLAVDVGGLDRVGDLTALARAGLAGLLGPGLASLERLRLVQGRAAVVEKGGGKANKGDVVVVLDQSGSMEGARGLWANALALAVVLETRAEHRTAAVVTFNGAVRASIVVDSPVGMRAAMQAICTAPSGGTALRPALDAAGRCLASMRRGVDPADLLLVTDGEWDAKALDGGTLDRARLRGVFVGGDAPEGARFASTWTVQASDQNQATAVQIARTVV